MNQYAISGMPRNQFPTGRSPLRAFRVLSFALAALAALSSCATASRLPVQTPAAVPERVAPPPVPELIMGTGLAGMDRLSTFLLANNPSLDPARARLMARLYLEEAPAEGVNADVAFSQMCVETGFLKFGGLVSAEMNNFCGLGSIGPGQPGLSFPDERTGVRAHVQHLKAYGSTEPLSGVSVDPRYRYVIPKGKSPTIAGLSGTWAADPAYAVKLRSMLERLYAGS